jgi:hypothetical protein
MTALNAAEEEPAGAAGLCGGDFVPPDVEVLVVADGDGVAGGGAACAAVAGRAALITRATAAAVSVCTGMSSVQRG